MPSAPPPVPIPKPIGLQILSTMSLLHTAHAGDNWSDNPISIELKTPRLSIVPRTLSGTRWRPVATPLSLEDQVVLYLEDWWDKILR